MWLYKAFDWFAKNPAAQWAVGIGAAYVAFRVWLAGKVRRERREAAEEVVQKIEERTDEAIQRVETDRDRVSDLNDAELRRLAQSSPHNRGRVQRSETD